MGGGGSQRLHLIIDRADHFYNKEKEMKGKMNLTALLLVLLMCFTLLGGGGALAADNGVEAIGAAEVAYDETVEAVDEPGFWEEFREEYAEDAEYLKWYEIHQQQAEEEPVLRTQSVADGTTPPYTTQTYDHGAKKNDTISYGIDVSYFQPNIDWNKVKKAGITYVILRCGRTSYGEKFNILGEDPKFKEHLEGAYKAGLAVGVYYFSQATTEAEAEKEANETVNILKNYQSKLTLPVFLDVEQGTNYRINKVSKAQGVKNAKKYFDILKNAGFQPALYGNAWDIANICDYTKLTEYPLWLARYNTKSDFSGEYEYWQYTSSGKISGITEGSKLAPVDCNFRYTPAVTTPPMVSAPAPTPKPEAVPPEEPVTPEEPVLSKPAAVTGLKKTAGTTSSLSFAWDAVEGAEKYQVLYSPLKNGTYKAVGTTTKTSFKVTGLKANHGYYVRVRAWNPSGWGPYAVTGGVTAQGQKRTLYTVKKATLYSNVGTEFSKLTTVPKNTVLDVSKEMTGTDLKQWFYVSYKDANGETFKGYLRAESVKVGLRAKATIRTKMRKSAKASAATKKVVAQGKKVILFSSKKGTDGATWYSAFYKAGSKTYSGYLNAAYVLKY